MSSRIETQSNMQDMLKWFVAGALLCAGLAGFYYFADESTLLRVIGLLIAFFAAVAVASQTEHGRTAFAFMRESRTELRKVVWPTRKETTQTTLIVMAVVVLVAIILWLLDTLLGWLVQLLLGTGG